MLRYRDNTRVKTNFLETVIKLILIDYIISKLWEYFFSFEVRFPARRNQMINGAIQSMLCLNCNYYP